MARNRKNQPAVLKFVPALKALIICLLLGASSVGYVLQKNKIFDLGRQIREREQRLDLLKQENTVLYTRFAEMMTPSNLQLRLRQHHLDLALPQPDQIVRLEEPTLNNTNHNNTTHDAGPLLVFQNGTSRALVR